MGFDLSIWKTEVRRGIVEMCLLSLIKEREVYGYEAIEQIERKSGLQLTESTVYPMLNRLAKEGLLSTRQEQSPHGPLRRYFRITKEGNERLAAMLEFWSTFHISISKLIGESTGEKR